MLPPPPPLSSRVDVGELKLQLAKRLGAVRARRYFSCLHRLLSQKLSKAEFNKLCVLILGPENLPLHNELIRSVIRNACQAATPPFLRKSLQREDGLSSPQPPVWANGGVLPPRACMSCVHKSKDRQSIPGLKEKTDTAAQQNDGLVSYGLNRQLEGKVNGQEEQPVKMCWLNSKGLEEVVIGEDRKSLEQRDDWKPRRSSLQAPLGIPFCPARVGRVKRSLLLAGRAGIDSFSSYLDNGELCHTEALRIRMERVAEVHGVGGVMVDCANLLNNGLDAYLKRLIKSCIGLVGARVGCERIKKAVKKEEVHKPINGVWLNNNAHVQSSSGSWELQERKCNLISLQDFIGAMELNPHQLGKDALLFLEKIRLHSFEE